VVAVHLPPRDLGRPRQVRGEREHLRARRQHGVEPLEQLEHRGVPGVAGDERGVDVERARRRGALDLPHRLGLEQLAVAQQQRVQLGRGQRPPGEEGAPERLPVDVRHVLDDVGAEVGEHVGGAAAQLQHAGLGGEVPAEVADPGDPRCRAGRAGAAAR
jgi:hypothetical protein